MNDKPNWHHREKANKSTPRLDDCLASNHIVLDGMKVGFMYREASSFKTDSGWRFFSGEETEEYSNDGENVGVFELDMIAEYDPAVVPYLDAPEGSSFGRVPGTNLFEEEEFIDDEHAEEEKN